MKRPSIGDDQPHHPSKAESLQVLPIALEILLGLGPEDPMGRQEFIERRPRTEAEQPPEFGPGQMTGLVFFERQCFERAALEIGNGAEALDEVVGDSDSDIHADNVSPRGLPVHHLPARRAVIRAHNIVSADYFSGLGDRLTPAAVIPMHTPEEAIAELEFVTKPLGSKVGMFGSNMARKVPAAAANDPDTARLRCGTTCSASTDPVWKKCFELGIAPTFHSASSNQGLRLSPTNFTYNTSAISLPPGMRPPKRSFWAASRGASRNCALRFSKAGSAGPASFSAI